jgi:predicted nucleotide-binding protein
LGELVEGVEFNLSNVPCADFVPGRDYPTMPGRWFRKRLKDARRRLDLTQNELGKKFGVAGTMIHFWETGAAKPRPERRERVERWLAAAEKNRQVRHPEESDDGRNKPRTVKRNSSAKSQGRRKVFVVHGQDKEAKLEVQVFLHGLDLEAVVLQQQPDKGFTIIEKFEHQCDVDFALVLLTPDDIGGSAGASDPKPRARQNVVLELGYFFGKLGRERVRALHKGDVEIPSDISGILWVEMDKGGAWKTWVAREMRNAGLPVDLNNVS